MDIDPPGEFIGAGGEHDVWHSDRGAFVSKVTNHGQFGFVVDQESDNRSNKLTLRPALPSEYLLRMGSENVVFGDSIRLEAIQRNQPPSWIVAQPYVDQGRPPQSDIDTFMEQCGFRQVPRRMVMSQYHDKPFWYRDADSILTADANPENFSRVDDHTIVPIDIIIHPMPVELMESTAFQCGVKMTCLSSS